MMLVLRRSSVVVLFSLSLLLSYAPRSFGESSLFSGPSPSLYFPESENPGCYKSPSVTFSLVPQVGILEHSWLGSAVDNWIFKFLVEEQLGIGVKMVNAGDLPTFPTDSNGYGGSPLYNATLHVDLEYWVYAPDSWYDTNVGPNQLIEDLGPTGFAGQVGWYIPSYLLGSTYFDGQLDYWRVYRLPDVAGFFATAKTNYSSGEWAGGYDDWGPDSAMIRNLKLNFTPVWYEVDLLSHLYSSYPQRLPLFIYLWTPLGVFQRYNMTRVSLPTYSALCWQDLTEVDCDYALVIPRKIAASVFDTDFPEAAALVKNFAISAEVQEKIMSRIEYDNLTIPEAVCEWLKSSESIWKPWIVVRNSDGSTFSLYTTESSTQQIDKVAVIVGVVVSVGGLLALAIGLYFYMRGAKKRKELKLAPKDDVALVFTDIQGSTNLWETSPNAMHMALELHNACIRRCIQENNGYEVKTVGDSFVIAFHSTENAARFMLSAQHQLLVQPWSDSFLQIPVCDSIIDSIKPKTPTVTQQDERIPACGGGGADGGEGRGSGGKSGGVPLWRGLRVRMGCHVGPVEKEYSEVSGRVDYFGPTVNMAARVESVAHGGEILVSEAVFEDLEATYSQHLKNVGSVKLKGISISQTLFQLSDDFLSSREFPSDYDRSEKPTVLERAAGDKQLCDSCSRPLICKYCSRRGTASYLQRRGTLTSRPSRVSRASHSSQGSSYLGGGTRPPIIKAQPSLGV